MTDEKNPDLDKTRDAVVEFAKELMMVDFQPLLRSFADSPTDTEKEESFRALTVCLRAARTYAEDFRRAHVEGEKASLRREMESQFKDRLAEIERVNASGMNPVLRGIAMTDGDLKEIEDMSLEPKGVS